MNLPIKHHFWPVCHSKFWKDSNGKINTYERGGVISSDTPKRTARIEHLNSIRMSNGAKNVWFEVYLDKEIEDKAAPALFKLATEKHRNLSIESRFDRRIMDGEKKLIREDGFVPMNKCYAVDLNQIERWAIARYVASMMVRVPSYKNPINSNDIIASLKCEYDIEENAAVQEADILSVQILIQHMDQYAKQLMKCALVIAETRKVEFVFCDAPVIPSALGWGSAEAVIPISPNRILTFMAGWKSPHPDQLLILEMLPKFVKSTNKTLIQNADQYVYSRNPVATDFVFTNLGTRQIRSVPTIEVTSGAAHGKGGLLVTT